MTNNDPGELLAETLETMNVPLMRRNDLRWLSRNLAINNAEHPKLLLALHLIKVLLKTDEPRNVK